MGWAIAALSLCLILLTIAFFKVVKKNRILDNDLGKQKIRNKKLIKLYKEIEEIEVNEDQFEQALDEVDAVDLSASYADKLQELPRRAKRG